jgi:hypothetical protein
LSEAYRAKGIRELYSQPASTAELVRDGKNVVVVTPTAYFFGSSPEHAHIQPDNLEILVNHLKCAASRVRIARQGVEANLKPAAKVLDSGEGVSFAARVLNGGLISRPEIQADQPEVSFCRIQRWVEAPGPGNSVRLQFSQEVSE